MTLRWQIFRCRKQLEQVTPVTTGHWSIQGNRSPPLSCWKESATDPLPSALCSWVWSSDIQKYERLNLCLKSQTLGLLRTATTGTVIVCFLLSHTPLYWQEAKESFLAAFHINRAQFQQKNSQNIYTHFYLIVEITGFQRQDVVLNVHL